MTINLEPIKAQLSKDIGGYICLHRDDMAGLISEVEHLRGERAAVVAWLRAKAAGMPDLWAVTATAYHLAANTFEDGEHRREEEK
jgi:hypothetical protein